jgi:hypothetical protein
MKPFIFILDDFFINEFPNIIFSSVELKMGHIFVVFPNNSVHADGSSEWTALVLENSECEMLNIHRANSLKFNATKNTGVCRSALWSN